MARQTGIFKLEGTIGDISFYKTKDGYLARTKGGVDASRIQNDPAFQRTRENGQEFGRAGSAGRLLRSAFRQYIQNSADSKMVSRLTREMIRVVKADQTNVRGLRNVLDGELEMLKGFEFNIEGKLTSTFYAVSTSSIDRETGELSINIPSFVPANDIASPEGATHARLISAGAEVDFENDSFQVVTSQSDLIELNQNPSAVLDLMNQLPVNTTGPLFLVLGIVFYQSLNGVDYPLKNGKYNSLSIVEVNGA